MIGRSSNIGNGYKATTNGAIVSFSETIRYDTSFSMQFTLAYRGGLFIVQRGSSHVAPRWYLYGTGSNIFIYEQGTGIFGVGSTPGLAFDPDDATKINTYTLTRDATGNVTWYTNDKQKGSIPVSNAVASVAGGDIALSRRAWNNSSNGADATLFGFKIWSSVLTQQQVLDSLYDNLSVKPDILDLDFNYNRGTFIGDKSGNDYHGTIQDSADYGSDVWVDGNQNTAK